MNDTAPDDGAFCEAVAWAAAVTGVPAAVIATDGKTVRRFGKAGARDAVPPPGHQAIHGSTL